MAHVVRQGVFHGHDSFHYGEGMALLIETAPGVTVNDVLAQTEARLSVSDAVRMMSL